MRAKRKNYRKFCRDYFGFSVREQNGFLVLILLSGGIFLGTSLSEYFLSSPQGIPKVEYLSFQVEKIDSHQKSHQKDKLRPKKFTSKERRELQIQAAFNPNQVSEESLLALNIDPYVAKNWAKYVRKGGYFRKEEDLLRIYGMKKAMYEQLRPYLIFPNPKKKPKTKVHLSPFPAHQDRASSAPIYSSSPTRPKLNPFDLNLADTSQLKRIRGIGQVLAKRIVYFRDKLGGFYDLKQIKEVYNLSLEAQQELLKHAYLEQPIFQKIALNSYDVKAFAQHPYISYDLARTLVNYRKAHGLYQSIEDLRKIRSINSDLLNNLAPYLSFD